jgi:hypothetical protein
MVFSIKVGVTILIACVCGFFVWIPAEPPLPMKISHYTVYLNTSPKWVWNFS